MPLILTETKKNIGIITFNNPKKLHCLGKELIGNIVEALGNYRKKNAPAVIIRAPENSRVWSAGHDVSELPRRKRDPLGYFDSLELCLRTVEEYPGAVIAMIQGSVWGAACDLVMACDITIGDKSSTFAMTPAKLGIPYNTTGILHFMNRLPLNVAKEMFFTSEPINALRAARLGILNHLVSPPRIFDFTFAMARTIASRSSLSVRVIKEQFRHFSKAYPLSPEVFERIQGLRRKVYDSEDYAEGITAFLEKREPEFQGK